MKSKEAIEIVEKYPDSHECHGFFWCARDGSFRCVVLACHETRAGFFRDSGATEFSGATGAELVANAEVGGFELGDVAEVEQSCLRAPCSPRPRRKRGAA